MRATVPAPIALVMRHSRDESLRITSARDEPAPAPKLAERARSGQRVKGQAGQRQADGAQPTCSPF